MRKNFFASICRRWLVVYTVTWYRKGCTWVEQYKLTALSVATVAEENDGGEKMMMWLLRMQNFGTCV